MKRLLFSFLAIFGIASFETLFGQNRTCVESIPGLIGWWRGDSDSAVNGHQAVFSGQAFQVSGRVDEGYRIGGGAGDGLVISNSAPFAVADFTIGAWIRRAELGRSSLAAIPDGAIFAWGDLGYTLTIDAGGGLFLGHVGQSSSTPRPVISDLEWHHVVLTKNGSTVRFYIDGVASTELSVNHSYTFSGPVGIGRLGTAYPTDSGPETYSFLGDLDEITVFGRALSSDEASSLFTSTTMPGCNNLLISFLGGPRRVDVGHTLDVELRIENFRSETASNITVEIPSNLGFSALRGMSQSGLFSNTNGVLRWSIDQIQPSASVVGRLSFAPSGLADFFTARAGLTERTQGTNVTLGSAVLDVTVVGPCVSRPSGLVGWWRLEGNGLEEISGGSGEAVGQFHYRQGKVALGGTAEGGQSVLLVGSRTAWRTQDPTIEMWVRRRDTNWAAAGQIAGAFFSGGVNNYGVGMFNDGRLYFAIQGHDAVDSGQRIQDLEWHHVVIGRSEGVVRFFIDGQFVQSVTYSRQASFESPFAIGGLGTPLVGDRYGFLGDVDEVSLYDRPLSEGEVQALYRADHFGKCVGDLVLDVSAPDSVAANSEFEVGLAVRNLDRSTGFDATVSNAIPAGARYVGGQADHGSIIETNGVIVWTLPDAAGDRTTGASLRFQAPADSRLLTNTARLTARTGDVSTANNVVSKRIEVEGPCGPGPAGLLAWFSGDDGPVESLSGQAVTGTTPISGPGRVGTAITLDGASSGFSLPAIPALETQDFTIETWLRRHSAFDVAAFSANETATIAGIEDGGPNFSITKRGELVLGRSGGLAVLSSSAFVADTLWHHVAVAKSGTSVTFYVDGVEAGAAGFAETFTYAAPWGIGALSPSHGLPLKGDLDEIAFYNRALAAGEVAAIYGYGSSGRCTEDIVLTATVSTNIITGDLFAQVLRVENHGASPATGVRVTNLFDGLEFVGATNSSGTSIVSDGPGRLVWMIGNLPGGTNAETIVTFRSNADGTNRLSAVAVRNEPDLSQANNSVSLEVVSFPLTLSVAGPAEPVFENSGSVPFTVRLFPSSPRPVAVRVMTADGSAIAGLDYASTNGVIEFAPGTAEQTVNVMLIDNAVSEGTEEFRLVLTNAAGASIVNGEAVAVIADNEPVPLLSVDPARIIEGDSGRTALRFEVRLTGPTEGTVTAQFATLNDTARAGSDFLQTNGVVTLPPGEVTTHFEVTVLGDRTVESNELFFATMSAATNALLRTTNAPGVIINDDAAAGQIAGFRWDGVPTNRLPVGATIPAALTAIDGLGTPVADFSGAVTVGAYVPGFKPATLVVSEVLWQGANDTAEFQNVTTNALDVSGWRISFYDASRWPLPKTTFTMPPGTTVPPRGLFTLVEGAGSPNIFPTLRIGVPLTWRDNVAPTAVDPMAILVQSPSGDVVDFVGLDGAEASEIALPVTLASYDWTGPSISFVRSGTTSALRRGSFDSNSAADWSSALTQLNNIGRTNAGLTLPFADAASLPITPSVVLDFTNGVWAGEFSLGVPSALFALFADDGNGNTGVSSPLTSDVPNNLAVTLVPDIAVVTNGGFANFTLSITNPGPDTATNVQATVGIDRAITSVSAISFPGERATVTFAESTMILRWNAGDLLPGTNRTLVFRQRVPSPTPASGPLFLVNEARIQPSVPDGDPSNDVAIAEIEVTRPAVDLTSIIRAWWTADLPGDGAVTNQSAPLGAPAILAGAVRGPGRIGSGWVFENAPGGVRVEPSASIAWSTNDRSRIIEGWLKLAPSAANGTVPVAGRRGTNDGWQINLVDGRPEITVLRGGMIAGTLSAGPLAATLADNRWHHLAVVQTSASAIGSIYTDGALQISAPLASLVGVGESEPLLFGADREGRTFAGSMDEWAILDDAAPPQSIYLAGGSGKVLFRLEIAQITGSLTASADVPFTTTLVVTNTGVGPAPAVRFAARAENAIDVSLDSTPGTNRVDETLPFAFIGEFGDIAAGSTGSVSMSLTATNVNTRPVVALSPSSASTRGRTTGIALQIFVTPDTDGDGMDDDWELLYGLDRFSAADATIDRDDDGIDNRSEFIAGTDPTSAASVFRLNISRSEGGGFRIAFQVGPDRDWILEEASGLGPDSTWNHRASGTTSGETTPVEVFSAEESGRLFRARISRR